MGRSIKKERIKEIPKLLQDRDKIFNEGFNMGFEAGIKEEKKEILILIKQLERKFGEVKE